MHLGHDRLTGAVFRSGDGRADEGAARPPLAGIGAI